MKLLIASNNAHKVREIEDILSGYFDEMVTMKEAGLDIDVVEDGSTFRENAVKKATEILEKSGFDATLADDTGLCVDALGGAPGVYSARYAGEGHDTAANNALLMENMKDVPDEKRTCRFTCCVALARKGRDVLVAEGKAEGTLLRAPAGENGVNFLVLVVIVDKGHARARGQVVDADLRAGQVQLVVQLRARVRAGVGLAVMGHDAYLLQLL